MQNKPISELSTEELGQLFPIIITAYNPQWPKIYLSEKERITNTVKQGCILQINHIGSTAIPNIKAKPTIDILTEVEKNFDKDSFIQAFKNLGYYYIPQPENPVPHIMFTKGYTPQGFKGQTFHVHVRFLGDWDEIVFRDYLIAHPTVALEYEKIKLLLAKKHKHNREDYTNAKTGFIKGVVKKARNGH